MSIAELAILLVLVVACLCIFFAPVGAEIVFRRTAAGKIWIESRRMEKRLENSISHLDKARRDADAKLAGLARRYEEHYIGRLLRRRPIRDLRPHIDVSMSWAALERAGMENLQQFQAFRGHFENLHGIGEARGQALRQARRNLDVELAESTLPMPTLCRPQEPGYRVIEAAVQAIKWRHRLAPRLKDMRERLEKLQAERPSAFSIRWTVWTGRGDRVCGDITALRDRLVDELQPEVEGLETAADELSTGRQNTDELMARYKEAAEPVQKLLDAATTRRLRKQLRPVGAAAMRAAEGFDDEEDFCDRVLEPLVVELGYERIREHTIQRRIGSRDKILYADFLLLDDQKEPLAVLEAKSRIRSERDIEGARDQGISYALFEEICPVMIAAPEGLWLYERQGQQAVLHQKYDIEEAFRKVDDLRQKIECLATAQHV